MFTGIIECLGSIIDIQQEQDNYHFTIASEISKQLKVDQSIAHDGVCLTVVQCNHHEHVVTAIRETMDKTALNEWQVGDKINLERCMVLDGRLDGHIVQGHVDGIGICTSIIETGGSWLYTFSYPESFAGLIISKGSITVNGTSLTVVNPSNSHFSVAIIPYTYDNTKFKFLKVGDQVNLEFDILGKYIQRNLSLLEI